MNQMNFATCLYCSSNCAPQTAYLLKTEDLSPPNLTRIDLISRLRDYDYYLIEDEKSRKTREKYLRDVKRFISWLGDRMLNKEMVIAYKEYLLGENYQPTSINSMLASIHSFFSFLGYADLRVRMLKIQREIYCRENKEMTKHEYELLLEAANSNPRMYMILMTLASTGIRISELQYFTAEAVKKGEVVVQAKGKLRRILLSAKLQNRLKEYMKDHQINTGIIFRTRYGNPIDRSNIWSDLKKLCKKAGVDPAKVFPHNLRKLFAKEFYELEKDISKVADVLGHSSINTTRIYIISSGNDHRKLLDRLTFIH